MQGLRENIAVLFVLLVKIGKPLFGVLIKFSGVLVKIVKGAPLAKLGLGAASFGAYSILIDWRFAIAIIALVGIHEYGHVWAMRRSGMKTRGFYFIPFLGGAAVPESAFPSTWAEGYVALMGPFWGSFVIFFTFCLYSFTGNQVFEVAACWMVFTNLLNLVPIYPLDGGRVLKSLIDPGRDKWRSLLMFIICLTAAIFCIVMGYWVFVFFGFFGFLSWFQENATKMKKPSNKQIKLFKRFISRFAKFLNLPKNTNVERIEQGFFELENSSDPVLRDIIKSLKRAVKEKKYLNQQSASRDEVQRLLIELINRLFGGGTADECLAVEYNKQTLGDLLNKSSTASGIIEVCLYAKEFPYFIGLFIALVIYPKDRKKFFMNLRKFELASCQEREMSLNESLAVAVSYYILIVASFLLMEFTGGHEAAEGAAKFFKKF